MSHVIVWRKDGEKQINWKHHSMHTLKSTETKVSDILSLCCWISTPHSLYPDSHFECKLSYNRQWSDRKIIKLDGNESMRCIENVMELMYICQWSLTNCPSSWIQTVLRSANVNRDYQSHPERLATIHKRWPWTWFPDSRTSFPEPPVDNRRYRCDGGQVRALRSQSSVLNFSRIVGERRHMNAVSCLFL
jgi:hypothetical protein